MMPDRIRQPIPAEICLICGVTFFRAPLFVSRTMRMIPTQKHTPAEDVFGVEDVAEGHPRRLVESLCRQEQDGAEQHHVSSHERLCHGFDWAEDYWGGAAWPIHDNIVDPATSLETFAVPRIRAILRLTNAELYP